ncbi:MAG: nuclease, partial [Paracoccaceae bacterium]
LADWIENDFAGTGATNYLLLGDMNAYAEEDPVQYLDDDAGLVDLIDRFIDQDNAYSFVFDGQQGTLDQGFASTDLNPFVTGATEWHINADEPDLINYDNSFKDSAFFNDGVFGSSDHDPLIIGLEFLPEVNLG